jgi:four helix bundle protein
MRTHRHLIAWQKARTVVLSVARVAKTQWQPWAGPMLSQLGRASLSVQLNIGEGWAFGRSRQRIRHWRIAYASAEETVGLLELLRDAGYLQPKPAELLLKTMGDVNRIPVHWLRTADELRKQDSGNTNIRIKEITRANNVPPSQAPHCPLVSCLLSPISYLLSPVSCLLSPAIDTVSIWSRLPGLRTPHSSR